METLKYIDFSICLCYHENMTTYLPTKEYLYNYSGISCKKIDQEAIKVSEAISSLSFRQFVTDDAIAERTYRFIEDYYNHSLNIMSLILNGQQKPHYHTNISKEHQSVDVSGALKEMFSKDDDFIKHFSDIINPENSLGLVKVIDRILCPSIIVNLPSEYSNKSLGQDARTRLQNTFETLSLWFEQLNRLTPLNEFEQFTIRLIQSYDYSPKIVDIHFFAQQKVFSKFVPGNMFPGGFVARGEAGEGFMEFLNKSDYKESRRIFNLVGKTLTE